MSTPEHNKKPKMGDRWAHIDKLLSRTGPLAVEGFDEAVGMIRPFLQDSVRILVIGAGGLGCELLKDLALMGFRNIDVIDMDTIDLSNLNRQFLFREADIGSPKAEVAAKFIEKRVPGCKVTPHFSRIESKDRAFYKQFTVVVCGLDSIVARRWVNSMMHSLLRYDEAGELDQSSMIPLVDGGTEGFQGNARVIFPGMTACVECMLSLYTPQVNFPMCTIANTPRLPEHCIEFARLVLWPKHRDDQIDGDNPEHITWLFEKARERAAEFGIGGVTYRLTQGVTKRIIPNVASTSAVIAAACANEVFKVVSSCTKYLDNNLIFNDVDGVYTYAYKYDRDPDCLTCSNKPVDVACSPEMSLTHLRETLCTSDKFQLRGPGLTTTVGGKNKTLYMARPAALEQATRPNLDKSLAELGLEHNQMVNVVDPTVAGALRLRLVMKQQP
ncbi:NEDD8-activating enzyme E1 catalytic subunit [Salpingoeca rosetta]|uniref:NEDD8-activating enzyme E1 catalytic subunit n=1 Tax=Salpingoeca rosetta (strain ATCC 50818 / BSB-021) TaxID=946362 RepID=F2TW79_SALR5|nr:NEDD8-activating enzyme E1 catalytic subunit [Salpingoeca rosetta]EGD72325.1 NEDD8-activating enzyme E1 catalytic subunit [Salpingoeca rosetta]|eukprot:XP_004998895.1 NEDD8-activating enzyme E1 catalytic subunit [Salpingoeca rosetta]